MVTCKHGEIIPAANADAFRLTCCVRWRRLALRVVDSSGMLAVDDLPRRQERASRESNKRNPTDKRYDETSVWV